MADIPSEVWRERPLLLKLYLELDSETLHRTAAPCRRVHVAHVPARQNDSRHRFLCSPMPMLRSRLCIAVPHHQTARLLNLPLASGSMVTVDLSNHTTGSERIHPHTT